MQVSQPIHVDSRFPSVSHEDNRGEYFSFRPDAAGDPQVEVLSGGIQYCPKGYTEEFNHGDYYSIEFIASGIGSIKLRENLFQMCSGTVYFHGPNIPCQVESTSAGSLKKYFVNFRVKDSEHWEWKRFLENYNPTMLSSHQWLAQLMTQIIECGRNQNSFSANTCGMLLKYLISRISEEGNQVPVIMGMARDSYEKARQHIEENFLCLSRISEVSRACNMSQPHISRLFKRFSEQSPSELLITLKLEHAAQLLSEGRLLVKEIAYQVGFSDQYYFSTRFKQIYGVSPSKFTRLNQPLSREGVAAVNFPNPKNQDPV